MSAANYKNPAYGPWGAMMARCLNPGNSNYPSYGARGITVCAEWRDFTAFLRDMGERPPGTSIDRIDNTKGYEPGNCRWATPYEQQVNKTCTRRLTIGGETRPLVEWARIRDVPAETVKGRLRRGLSHEQALEPVRRKLGPDQVSELRSLVESGMTITAAAELFGVSWPHVYYTIKGRPSRSKRRVDENAGASQ